MTDQFLFSITVTQSPQFDALLSDVAEGVLAQVGFDSSQAIEILDAFRAGIARESAKGFRQCDAVFRTEAGRLVIVVTRDDGHEWRLARPLPSPD